MKDEEKRLDDLMEQERLKELAKEKEELLLQQKKKEEYINDLNDQVKRNLLEREMEAEKQLEVFINRFYYNNIFYCFVIIIKLKCYSCR